MSSTFPKNSKKVALFFTKIRNMTNHKSIVRYIYMLLILCSIAPFNLSGQNNSFTEKIWEGIGGKTNWDNTRYIMFTVAGNEKHPEISGSRKFLVDRTAGNLRFEGRLKNQNVVALLNAHSGDLQHIYTESGAEMETEDYRDIIPALIDQYTIDFKILSLPVSLLSSSMTGQPDSKILNAEKMLRFEFNSFLGDVGAFYISEDTGLLRRMEFDGKSYIVDGHRDVGNGLILPTVLKGSTDSVTYQKVASFTEMEPEKFTEF